MEVLAVDEGLRLRPSGQPPEHPHEHEPERAREHYVIERRTDDGWETAGEVALERGSLTLTVPSDLRRQGIGRRVLLRLVDRARVLGWEELRVSGVEPGDDAARRLLDGLGFRSRPDDSASYALRLAPLDGRPR